MKKLLLAAILVMGMAGNVWAGGMQGVGGSTTLPRITMTVYNDSGSDLTSGTVVVWDNDDTEFDQTLYPYVTTTTTNGSPYTAGVTLDSTCLSANTCEIVVYGPVMVRSEPTGTLAEDVTVATSANNAGMVQDWDGGAGECSLGVAMSVLADGTGTSCETSGTTNCNIPVFVNISCED